MSLPREDNRGRRLDIIANQWYVILGSREVKRGSLLGVTRLGERLVLARDGSGKVFCLRDR